MQFEIPEEIQSKAKVPHEIFVTNLVGNHILWFVAALGLFNSYWQPMVFVPVVSATVMIYTFSRARKSRKQDDWFVMCHWQLAARRSKVFSLILCIGLLMGGLGWVGYNFFGMQKVAVLAMVGGVALLPVMVSVLVLVVMEADALYLASSGKMSKTLFERYPNDSVKILEDDRLMSNQDVESR